MCSHLACSHMHNASYRAQCGAYPEHDAKAVHVHLHLSECNYQGWPLIMVRSFSELPAWCRSETLIQSSKGSSERIQQLQVGARVQAAAAVLSASCICSILSRLTHLLAAAHAHEHLWSGISKGPAGCKACRQVGCIHDASQPHIPCAHACAQPTAALQSAPNTAVGLIPTSRLPMIQFSATSLAGSQGRRGRSLCAPILATSKPSDSRMFLVFKSMCTCTSRVCLGRCTHMCMQIMCAS